MDEVINFSTCKKRNESFRPISNYYDDLYELSMVSVELDCYYISYCNQQNNILVESEYAIQFANATAPC